ncbi:hypothetical protein M5W83_09755 [Paenibacillus thiaminolyticus]|uniref:50S ribosomal protein L33 n=1 Tax=Paenibacillus thiaminolyticus TaxID=49283 RepID=A0AAP9J1B3_PANTH|nr:50S ribosomal protein L33 [Paenibacillus thiaminolyticus]MCY9537426.1 hypothetical protein [Paenibacillus thiaminolyticus]MCY9601113.1 hypothetical protein [Paenibacillus thiaminolyticus]MCY9607435.1 hypothetical protein [Paenibacillus thiaminolyticus]MCY9613168.1 hypothetical protein [Paenibacillus thiaminolyticus]MCY9617583.1 hypothetical protein [Paenibacillus thiaminolyticus]
MHGVTKAQASKLVGKRIYALHKNGSVVSGKLIRISGNRLIMAQSKGKKVRTKAIIPLVLFDLLAIGTAPFAFGGFPYGGYGGYGGHGFGGYPYGRFW